MSVCLKDIVFLPYSWVVFYYDANIQKITDKSSKYILISLWCAKSQYCYAALYITSQCIVFRQCRILKKSSKTHSCIATQLWVIIVYYILLDGVIITVSSL